MEPVGDIKNHSLSEIVNNEQAEAYRHGLQTGELMPVCRTCPDRATITIQEFLGMLERAVV
jgi:hypothetical protein